MNNTVRVVSIFSVDKAAGHSVYDDIFYFDLFRSSGHTCIFYVPPYSLSQIKKKCSANDGEIRAISADRPGWMGMLRAVSTIPVLNGDRVVFLGYSEKFVFLFRALNVFKKYSLVLVATNNISHRRVTMYRTRLRVFFRFLGKRLTRLVVHTDEELRLCRKISEDLYGATVVKKHYLMIPKGNRPATTECGKPIIAFFGPDKYYKPVQPIVDLMRADRAGAFRYRLYNVDREALEDRVGPLPEDDIDFINRRLGKEEYFSEFSNSSFVMMTHDKGFEGKLSGNFCDCVSTGVPFLSSSIEPIPTFFGRYGPIGYVCNFADPDWSSKFLREFSPQLHEELSRNLRSAQADYARTIVERDNIEAILGP